MTGEQSIDSGIIERGETVVFGSYNQMGIDFDEDQVVMNFVKENVEGMLRFINAFDLVVRPQIFCVTSSCGWIKSGRSPTGSDETTQTVSI